MLYELFIGLRYTRSRKRAQGHSKFVSFITVVSIIGIALGIATLIIVLSVMNGFQERVKEGAAAASSHIEISSDRDFDWEKLVSSVEKHPDVVAAAPFLNAQGMLKSGFAVRGVQIRGIHPDIEARVASYGEALEGQISALKAGEFGILLGQSLARSLDAEVGDKLTLMVPEGTVSVAAVIPRVRQFTVVGIFSLAPMYDSQLAIIHLADGQALFRMGTNVSGIRLKLKDLFQAPGVSAELQQSTKLNRDLPPLWFQDWTQLNKGLLEAVELEKTMMTIALFLIVAVAAFNVIVSLTMTVQEKAADIAILRTLGASPGSIMKIFIVQGTIIGLLGLFFGLFSGLLLANDLNSVIRFLEVVTNQTLWNPEVYGMEKMPSQVVVSDVVKILVTSFVLTLLAAIYPSWRASKVKPAEALRYE